MNKNFLKSCLFFYAVYFSRCLLAEAQNTDLDTESHSPIQSLVIIKNPNLLRHQYCLGALISSMMVVTALECSKQGLSTSLEIFENIEDINNESATSYRVSDVKPGLDGGKLAYLYLETPMTTKVPREFIFPELAGSHPATFYFLAKQQSEYIINQRTATLKEHSSEQGNRFTVFVSETDNPIFGNPIYGAVLFDSEQWVIGVAFDEMYLYSYLDGAAYFYSVTVERSERDEI